MVFVIELFGIKSSSRRASISPGVLHRNAGVDRRPLAARGSHLKGAADHFHSLAHPEQSQSFVFMAVQQSLDLKGSAIVLDAERDGIIQPLDIHFYFAGLG